MCGIVGIDYNNISVEVCTIMWRATVSTYNHYNKLVISSIINHQVYTSYCLNMYLGDNPWGVIYQYMCITYNRCVVNV